MFDLEPAVNRQPGFPRDVTRREGSACDMASTVIILKRGTLPKLPGLLKIVNTPCMCDTTCHSNKVIEKFENCDPSESYPHSRQIEGDACELFEAWLAR